MPDLERPFGAACEAVSSHLVAGSEALSRLPPPRSRSADERVLADSVSSAAAATRERFLGLHASELYDLLTDHCRRQLRVDELVGAAASQVPGLVPSAAEVEAERGRTLGDKLGVEIAQGILVAQFLALPAAGRHLISSMHAPTARALELLPRFRAEGFAQLGPVKVTRRGSAGLMELSNPRHLNAEDQTTLWASECAVDLVLLDDQIDVGVIRGGVVDRPGYANDRVFGAGINLTHLYQGRIDFLFYLVRDLGYVSKIYRGILRDPAGGSAGAGLGEDLPPTTEKPWIAAVESFAVGGACQLLHVVDHVIATRGARLYLPARKEGIIPGASNLRLPRFVGDKAARQAILSGREWTAGEPDADLLCDEVVEPADMEGAIEASIEALTNSGLINAAANRRAMRVGEEPLDVFRQYMSTFSREQAYCHLSPALVSNLEVHWRAHERSG